MYYQDIDDETYQDNKEYVYQLRYCKKGIELSVDSSKGITTREISGFQECRDQRLTVESKTWYYGHLRNSRKSVVEGTIDEMVIKHKMGIDSFNHFRHLVNQIIPFKKEVISSIVSYEVVKRNHLSLFIPDYDLGEIEKQPQIKLTPNNK